jgi:hypothetical protein
MDLSPAGVALGLALAPDPSRGPALALVGGLLGTRPAGLVLLVALAGSGRPRQAPAPVPEPAPDPAPYPESAPAPTTEQAPEPTAAPAAGPPPAPKRPPAGKRSTRRTSTRRTNSGGGA